MSTPLRLARDLRLAFPKFRDVKVARAGPYTLRLYCLVTPGCPAAREAVEAWVETHHNAGTKVDVEQVTAFPDGLEDDEALLARAGLKRFVVEESSVTRLGVLDSLRAIFPVEVTGLSEPGGNITVHVASTVPPEREQPILDAARLFMACDPKSLKVSRQTPHSRPSSEVRSAESESARMRLAEDRALLQESLPKVIAGENVSFAEVLPSGSTTYASPHDGISSLHQRLALFDKVFVEVPFKREDFPQWAGTRLDEFLFALPTGRIVPVLAHTADRYEPGLLSQIVDVAPRTLLHGEAMLRAISTFASEHPLLPLFGTEKQAIRDLRLALRTLPDPHAKLVVRYVDAVADAATTLATAAMRGPSLAIAWHPISKWLDEELGVAFRLPSRELEFGTAIDVRIMTEMVGGRPMSQAGHYLDGYLRFVYGAQPGGTDLLRVPDPEMIGRICFPDAKGLSLREFAQDFRGPVVTAMRELMSSQRVQTASGSEDLVKRFNEELRQYARRADAEYAAVGTLLAVVGLFAGFGVPAALAGLSLELARRVLGRKAPGLLANIAGRMTLTSREAALLARIKTPG